MNTAVPSLHLEPSESESVHANIDESGNLAVDSNVVYLSVAPEAIENEEQIEIIIPDVVKPIAEVQNVKSKYAARFMCCNFLKQVSRVN